MSNISVSTHVGAALDITPKRLISQGDMDKEYYVVQWYAGAQHDMEVVVGRHNAIARCIDVMLRTAQLYHKEYVKPDSQYLRRVVEGSPVEFSEFVSWNHTIAPGSAEMRRVRGPGEHLTLK